MDKLKPAQRADAAESCAKTYQGRAATIFTETQARWMQPTRRLFSLNVSKAALGLDDDKAAHNCTKLSKKQQKAQLRKYSDLLMNKPRSLRQDRTLYSHYTRCRVDLLDDGPA